MSGRLTRAEVLARLRAAQRAEASTTPAAGRRVRAAPRTHREMREWLDDLERSRADEDHQWGDAVRSDGEVDARAHARDTDAGGVTSV